MEKKDIPVSMRQIVYLALITAVPLFIAVAAVIWAPSKLGDTRSNSIIAVAVVALVFVGLAGVVASTLMRHDIEIQRDALVVRHSLYTFRVERAAVTSATMREVRSLDQLGMSSKKNGIAAFGYYSGWFWGPRGDLVFCGLSKWPVHLISFNCSGDLQLLALSITPETAQNIVEWASENA